jgi:tetratricopeptide (TPR) repeat protein
MPSKGTVVLPEGTYNGDENGSGRGRVPLPGEDADPVRSPDDPAPAAGSGQEQVSSSSLAGLDKLLPGPDDDQSDKKRKLTVKEPTHKEAASTDIDVGKYYLQTRNWKAAQSRFESAMVLDPENPEVYWGLAETERHLGDFADARAHYLKLLDYDPDGPHGKEARKALKDPEIANAKSPSTGQPAAGAPK